MKPLTKRIERRNENIRRYRKERKMTYRALGKMFKLSHTQIMNIIGAENHEGVEQNEK